MYTNVYTIQKKRLPENLKALFLYVGVRRLELPTPCTPCKYASQLRHTPIDPGSFSGFEDANVSIFFIHATVVFFLTVLATGPGPLAHAAREPFFFLILQYKFIL